MNREFRDRTPHLSLPMDNLCHSLAGAAIAQTGFARRLPRATLLAVIAANILDVDAVAYLRGDSAFAVSFRRGWTHGLPALVVWALLLAWLFGWRDRRPAHAGGALARTAATTPAAAAVRSAFPSPPTSTWAYFALALIAVGSHPLLDWLNTYGVRFLMPFSNEWFYGDALFIVDPVLIGLFGAGWALSRHAARAGWRRPAWPARADLMVAPLPFSFTRREVLVRTPQRYDGYPATWTGQGAVIGALASSQRISATRYAVGMDASWAGVRVRVR